MPDQLVRAYVESRPAQIAATCTTNPLSSKQLPSHTAATRHPNLV